MKYVLLVIGLIVVVAAGLFYFNKDLVYETMGWIAATDYKSIAYRLDGANVKLVNGLAETPNASGAASKVITKYFGNEVSGDFNDDGRQDAAFILTQETGGSGTFFYLVAALGGANGYTGTNGVLLGDRIAPQTTEFGDGIITVNYAERAPGEPMTAAPSTAGSMRLQVVGGKLVRI